MSCVCYLEKLLPFQHLIHRNFRRGRVTFFQSSSKGVRIKSSYTLHSLLLGIVEHEGLITAKSNFFHNFRFLSYATITGSRALWLSSLRSESQCIFIVCYNVPVNSKLTNLESPACRHAHQSLLLQRLDSGRSCVKHETRRKMSFYFRGRLLPGLCRFICFPTA